MDIATALLRVLVADDYPDLAELLAELITSAAPFPMEIAVVHDGAQALSKAISDQPDCAILDIDMPVLDGVAAAIGMRSSLGERAPLLIALTGNMRHADRADFRAAFDHIIAKPPNIERLVALVAQARSQH